MIKFLTKWARRSTAKEPMNNVEAEKSQLSDWAAVMAESEEGFLRKARAINNAITTPQLLQQAAEQCDAMALDTSSVGKKGWLKDIATDLRKLRNDVVAVVQMSEPTKESDHE